MFWDHNRLHGRDLEHRKAFRERVLSVQIDDLKRVANTYLDPAMASTAILTNNSIYEEYGDLGLEVHKL